jgi:UDP-N-acetylmuramate dehydrogenase
MSELALPPVRGQLLRGERLAPYTWFRVGGPADALFLPADEEDLAQFLRALPGDVPILTIGVGSNLIVRDGGVPGVVIRLAGRPWAQVEPLGGARIRAGAGALDSMVAKGAAKAGVAGLEFYVGVPGTIGGALTMNAGCYGRETKDVLVEATALDRNGARVTLSNADFGFTYRHNALPEGLIFLDATFLGTPDDPAAITARMAEITERRESSQPIREKTGGSTFKNPILPSGEKTSAWKLVHDAGMRGYKRGGAQVSEKHANFLINTGAATAADIERLGEDVRAAVKARHGVELEWEIKRVGRRMHGDLARDIEQVVAAARSGRISEAVALADRLVGRHPDAPEAWRLHAHIAMSREAFDDAIRAYRRALALRPDDLDLHVELAQAALAGNRRRAAIEAVGSALALGPTKPSHFDALGAVYTFCEEPALALPLFEAASLQEPTGAHLYNLAAVQRMVGQREAAEETLARVIAITPDETRAYLMRADLRRQSRQQNHIAELERAIAEKRGGDNGEIALCYAAAKELEDVGEHARSFAYLTRGARKQQSLVRYRIEDDIAMMDYLVRAHHEAAFASPAPGFDSPEPIFVIGLPRSGTTLVERILSAHPSVSSIGESPAFGVVVGRALQMRIGRTPSRRELVELSLDIDSTALGRDYIEETRPQSGKTARFVDKMLMNHLYVGLVQRALPNARIVVVRRDPMDTCFAMYRSYLTGAYAFTSSLRDIGAYYGAWSRLMNHWQSAPGPAIHVVQYEQLVAEPEATARRLLEFVGLPWDDRCLSFHLTPTSVTSASASQVREPIYASSVGKWKRHREQLGELIGALRAEGIPVD